MNWGKGIAVTLVLFMGFIVYLATILMTTKVDLESEDYYKREIAYEEEITAIKNARKQDVVKLDMDEANLIIQLPESGNYEEVQIDLFRPNDSDDDRTYQLTGSKLLTIDRDELKAGVYRVEISYRNGDDFCLQKEEIEL